MQRRFVLSVVLLVLFGMSSCTRKISPNIYKASAVGEVSETYQGVIINRRQVKVDESERLQDNGAGMAIGGIGGGLLGSQIGSGTKAGVLGAVLGAVAGGVAGAYTQEALSQQDAFEYVVKLQSGKLLTIVQGMDEVLQVGQHVLVMISKQGRSRIVPEQKI